MLVEFQCLPSGFLRPATCSCTNIAICACSVKAGSKVLHYGSPKPHLTVVHCATCSSSVNICLHKIIIHVHVGMFCGTLVLKKQITKNTHKHAFVHVNCLVSANNSIVVHIVRTCMGTYLGTYNFCVSMSTCSP